MNRSAPLLVLLLAVLGCGLLKKEVRVETFGKNENRSPDAVANTTPLATPADSANVANAPVKPASVESLVKRSAGKYPGDIKLLTNADLSARIRKLLGADYKDLKENWNVESPIQVIGDVAMTTGCEQHNCGSNIYYLFMDLKSPNINVFHFLNDEMVDYYEGKEITLPKKFADEIAGR